MIRVLNPESQRVKVFDRLLKILFEEVNKHELERTVFQYLNVRVSSDQGTQTFLALYVHVYSYEIDGP